MTDTLLTTALGLKPGDKPFAWQVRLFDLLLAGTPPSSLDLPTGLGKTSVMAIWLLARARGANLPRRLVYVVDRRVVVDQATAVAEALRDFVAAHPDIADGLKLGGRPLPISTLRGQFVDNKEWLDDPASPAIIIATVDMAGSRLLFEGYGVTRKMRPYHAGLLGADTLFVLDEAHLVPPFEKLLTAMADGQATFGPVDSSAFVPPRLLSLSATGRTSRGTPFSLEDHEIHGIVAQRMSAIKRLAIIDLDPEMKLPEQLALKVRSIIADKGPCRVLVFCNKRDDAQKTADLLKVAKRGDVAVEVELLVGARRVNERAEAAEWLADRGFIAGARTKPSTPVVLVATSAGEVGIDLDADHMVCDLVAWERMVQRLGRVNRRGEGEAEVAVMVGPMPKEPKEGANAATRAAVEAAIAAIVALRSAVAALPPADAVDRYDASPGAIRELKERCRNHRALERIINEATSIPPLYPALSRPVVEAWAMTSLREHAGRPAVAPWLRGWIEDDQPHTTVVWRRFLPTRPDSQTVGKGEVTTFFEAAPPHVSERLETEAFRVFKWLLARIVAVKSNDPSPFGESDTVVFALDDANELVERWTWTQLVALEHNKSMGEQFQRVLAGTVLVLDARLGGLTHGLLDETQDEVATTSDDGANTDWSRRLGVRVREGRSSDAPNDEASEWQERFRFVVERNDDGEKRWLSVESRLDDAATPNGRSLSPNPQGLDEHARWTENKAAIIAERIGLSSKHRQVLLLAARLHDEGKSTLRWQDAFRAPKGGRPFAKTRGPIDQARLDGYRHELGSYLKALQDERVLALDAELRDLALHLIVSHHGFARPIIGLRGVDDVPPSKLEWHAREIAERFARLQRRWGPWGLAWWEALLRGADQQASRANDLARKEGN